MRKLVLTFLLLAPSIVRAQSCVGSGTATVCTATTGNPTDVQAAIAAAPAGSTVVIPSDAAGGPYTWTAGVTDSGGHTITGAGSPRIIARDNGTDLITIASGTQTFHIAFYSPGFRASSISPGQSLLIYALAADTAASQNPMMSMTGTVTSITPGSQTCLINAAASVGAIIPCSDVLVMNITSITGSGTFHRWEVATVVAASARTTIINSSTSTALFTITQNTTFHEKIGNIHIVPGNKQQRMFTLNFASGGQSILLHDMWLRGDAIDLCCGLNTDSSMIEGTTNGGLIWNVSFESSKFDISTMAANTVKDAGNLTGAWTSPSFWGTLDTTGQNNFYCESDDFHAMGSTCDTDDNGRLVTRYNLYDNAGIESHGADTSHIGQRYFEIYDNVFIKDSYNNSTGGGEFNLPEFFFLRGGSFVHHDNYIPRYSSTSFGTAVNILMTVMNLQRDSGFNPCWGANPTTAGQYWYAPRQVGEGRVTGTGHTNYPPDSCTNCSTDSGGFYVGDIEPGYIWNNNNTGLSVALPQVLLSDYGVNVNPSGCAHDGVPSVGSTYDQTSNYIKLGRDYFNGTAKPNYTPYPYPHPLTSSGGTAPIVSLAPSSVAFGNVLVGSTTPSTIVKLTNIGNATLSVSSIALGGTNPTDFGESNNCGVAVLAGGSCNITVTCTPLSAASFSANVTITDNAAGSPQTIPLTCTGVTATAGISFTPTGVTFPGQTVGTNSAPTAVTVTNTGSANLTPTAVVVSGGNNTSFMQTNTCVGATVAPAGTCTINVTFAPKIAGALASSVCVTDNAAGSPQCFAVSGTGLGVAGIAFNPTSLAFGNQTVGGTTAALSVTVSNPGTGPTTLSSVTLTGTNAADFTISANTCPGSLAVGATCVVSATATPSATGLRQANLTFTDTAAGSPQNVGLTVTGTQAGTSFSPTSLAFGNQNVNSTSLPLTTTLTNTGSTTLNIASITITGAQASNFAISSKTCGTTLTASSTCTVSVTATPSAGGPLIANLSFADDAPGSPQSVPLSVTGVNVSEITIAPSSLTFPATVVGQSSPSQVVTVTNIGNTTITFTSIAVSTGNAGDFSQNNTCDGSLAPGNPDIGLVSSCTATVTFAPSATGTRASSLVFTSSATGSPQSVALSGTGTQSGALVSPTSISFPNTPVSTVSAAQNVTLQNNGTATLNIASFLLGGTDPSYFTISAHTCGTTLAPSASCTVSLTFTPQTAITANATLSFTDDGPGSPQVVTLSGLGTFLAFSFSPASLAFGSINVGTTSPAQTFTMANNGNGVATISGIAMIGTNAGDFSQTNNCPPNLSGGGSCTVSVKFLPIASGARSASVQVTDNAPGSPQTVALTGTGVTPTAGISLSPTSLTFASQGLGTSSASQPITVSNPGSGNLVISSVAVSGDYSQTNNCTTVAPAGTCTVNVTFTPTTTGTRTGVLTLSDNAAGSPHTAPLTGTGAAAAVSFVPASLTFPNTPVSSTSAILTTTLKNTGGASLTSIVISIVGTNASNFAQTNNCGTSVVAGGSCTINVTFTPSANGVRTANVQVVDNIGTQTVSLQGAGFTPAPAVSLSVASLNFGDQTSGTQSNPHVVVLTNVGTATLTVSAATKTGTNPGDYTVSTTCGASLAVNATCSYSIVFIPTAAGSRTATLNVNTNATSSPDLVSLTGNGVVSPQGVPSPQSFGDD